MGGNERGREGGAGRFVCVCVSVCDLLLRVRARATGHIQLVLPPSFPPFRLSLPHPPPLFGGLAVHSTYGKGVNRTHLRKERTPRSLTLSVTGLLVTSFTRSPVFAENHKKLYFI